MTVAPEIETQRLHLRAWRGEDIESLAAIRADSEAMRYIGAGAPLTFKETDIGGFRDEWSRTGCGRWALEEKETGKLIGDCGILLFKEGTAEQEPEVAYMLARGAWGRGLATEAATAAVSWAFENLQSDAVVGLTHPANAASQRVLAKLGFQAAGTFDGVYRRLNLYRVTSTEFKTTTSRAP